MSSPPGTAPSANASGAVPHNSQLQELQDQLSRLTEQIHYEKAGKRKLFHSLVKLAEELRIEKQVSTTLVEQAAYWDRHWYEGGLWRSPELLPAVASQAPAAQTNASSPHALPRASRVSAIGLSDLFFSLVVVTAFTRVGVAMSHQGFVSRDSLLYFAVFWTVWSKETSYTTRFDTTDLSAQVETLLTCFLVLFASLSVQAPIQSTDGTRIMCMAALVAVLHALLHARVAATVWEEAALPKEQVGAAVEEGGPMNHNNNTSTRLDNWRLARHIRAYALFNVIMNLAEVAVWATGILRFPVDWEYRWAVVTAGVVLALRVPRAFLANDFHGTSSGHATMWSGSLGNVWLRLNQSTAGGDSHARSYCYSHSGLLEARRLVHSAPGLFAAEHCCGRQRILCLSDTYHYRLLLHRIVLPAPILHQAFVRG